ncbi:MAG: transglutaminase domain-containing protein [Planctomycetota bacterium]
MRRITSLRWGGVVALLVLACLATAGAMLPRWLETAENRERVVACHAVADHLAEQPAYSVSRACSYVHGITTHSVDRRVDWTENWVQAIVGKAYPPLLRTQSPEKIVLGRKGDCSERVAVLQMMFRRAHLPTRAVGLGGHVVLEVRANGKWYTADPDYGVTFGTDVSHLEKGTGKWVRHQLRATGCDDEAIDGYLQILHSSVDNVAMGINQPLSPRLKFVEDVCDGLMVATPMLLWGLLAVLWASFPVFSGTGVRQSLT